MPAAPSPGEAVRQLRKERGLSHDQLAAVLGTSRQRIIAWEKGDSAISDKYAHGLAAWSGRPLNVFLAETQNGDGPPSAARRFERVVRELRAELRDVRDRLAAVEDRLGPPAPR